MKRLLIVLCLVLSGCGFTKDVDSQGKTLSVELPLKESSLAPYESYVPVQLGITETLFKVEAGKLKGQLVKDYEQKDSKTLSITLKDNIKFQNGKSLDAMAVKKSLEKSLKDSSLLKGSIPIQSIKAEGNKLEIKTKKPFPQLANELANPFTAIFDADAKANVNMKPIGTGPFLVEDFQPKKVAGLKKYGEYWQGTPKIERVKLSFHEDGNIRANHILDEKVDITTDIPIQKLKSLKSSDDVSVDITPGYRTSYIMYNFKSEKMNKEVRSAIDLLINRSAVAKDIFENNAKTTHSPFPDGGAAAQYNPDKAKQMIEKLGYTNEKPLQLDIATYDARPELTKILEVLQFDAKKAHIKINIRNVSDIHGFLSNPKNFDASMYNFLTYPRGDKSYFYQMAYMPEGSVNLGKYVNQDIVKKVNEMEQTVNSTKRASLENEIDKIASQDIPNSYIVQTDNIIAFNKKVKNIKNSPEGISLLDYRVDLDD